MLIAKTKKKTKRRIHPLTCFDDLIYIIYTRLELLLIITALNAFLSDYRMTNIGEAILSVLVGEN